MITDIQKKTSQAIINIFETGKPLGDYSRVTVIQGDPGHLTYGRSQTTLASGNLSLLLHAYCEASGKYSESIRPYLAAFDRCDLTLDRNEKLKAFLWAAGEDPIMKKVQDAFFDRLYWIPSQKEAHAIGATLPLSVTVIYDSKIHGSYSRIKNITIEKQGMIDQIGEKEWIKQYVSNRTDWLSNHRNSLIRKTVYRMNSLAELTVKDKWQLELPLIVRNNVISEDLFKDNYCWPIIASVSERKERILMLATPRMRGDDIKELQRNLGVPREKVDGIYGKATELKVREFQAKHGLKVDGRVGPLTRTEIGTK